MPAITAAQKKAYEALKAYALSLPEAWEDSPWGECAIKVKKKVFVFMSTADVKGATAAVGLSVKLPMSAGQALVLPFCSPTGYGLGKAGWVSCRFADGDVVPTDILLPWITESYLAIAPKTLAAKLSTSSPATKMTAKKAPATKKAATKKPATKNTPKKKTPTSATTKKTSARPQND